MKKSSEVERQTVNYNGKAGKRRSLGSREISRTDRAMGEAEGAVGCVEKRRSGGL